MTALSMWQVEIPAADEWINSNQRIHRMEEARRTAAWRAAGLAAGTSRGGYFTKPVRIVATVHKARGGRWDAGNLYPTAKAIVDGIVSAGVLYDDANEYVVGPDMRAGEKRPKACVVITITELEQEQP